MLIGVGPVGDASARQRPPRRRCCLARLAYAALDLGSAIARGTVRNFEPKALHDAIAVGSGLTLALIVMAFHRQILVREAPGILNKENAYTQHLDEAHIIHHPRAGCRPTPRSCTRCRTRLPPTTSWSSLAHNPFPKKARRLLDAAGIGHKYIEYGSYLGGWRRRNALKMWTGWPTMPMVFVKGVLVGGAQDLERLIASGDLARRK